MRIFYEKDVIEEGNSVNRKVGRRKKKKEDSLFHTFQEIHSLRGERKRLC